MPPRLPDIVGANIRAVYEARAAAERRKTAHERAADRVTAFAGSMVFVYVQAAIFVGWIAYNSLPGRGWDPFPFVLLAVITSMEAIFLSSFLLINQNRMQRHVERRAELDLQINLLAEREITRVLQTVDAIAKRVGAEVPAQDLHVLKQDVAPEQVLQEIERAEGKRL